MGKDAVRKLEKMIADSSVLIFRNLTITPEEWKTKGHEFDEIRDNMLGWDITDYGMGDFDKYGFPCLLFVTEILK